ncbi:uncharacterized protein LOC128585597 [Nycticebus coucang]|uniref:uncharacterized protein LOC128585597 n=1 Tax=Nycticebus coucang TaxID=9470 RepID=UPI00234DCB63|nr:uncharacterized protein LOC128585597 [Nycticebus coucang]
MVRRLVSPQNIYMSPEERCGRGGSPGKAAALSTRPLFRRLGLFPSSSPQIHRATVLHRWRPLCTQATQTQAQNPEGAHLASSGFLCRTRALWTPCRGHARTGLISTWRKERKEVFIRHGPTLWPQRDKAVSGPQLLGRSETQGTRGLCLLLFLWQQVGGRVTAHSSRRDTGTHPGSNPLERQALRRSNLRRHTQRCLERANECGRVTYSHKIKSSSKGEGQGARCPTAGSSSWARMGSERKREALWGAVPIGLSRAAGWTPPPEATAGRDAVPLTGPQIAPHDGDS